MIFASAFIAAADDFHLLGGLDDAIVNPADADSADVVIILNGGDAQLKRSIRIAVGRGDVLQNCFKERLNAGAGFFEFPGSGASAAGGVEDGEIKSLVVGAQFDEQIEHFVEHFMRAS